MRGDALLNLRTHPLLDLGTDELTGLRTSGPECKRGRGSYTFTHSHDTRITDVGCNVVVRQD